FLHRDMGLRHIATSMRLARYLYPTSAEMAVTNCAGSCRRLCAARQSHPGAMGIAPRSAGAISPTHARDSCGFSRLVPWGRAAGGGVASGSTAPAVPRTAAPGRSAIVGPAPAVKRDLCLIGYADLVSGRAEDLRTSALALRHQGRTWAIIDRLSGQITTESR